MKRTRTCLYRFPIENTSFRMKYYSLITFMVSEESIEMYFDLLKQSLGVNCWIPILACLTSGLLKSMAPPKQTFWDIKKDFI